MPFHAAEQRRKRRNSARTVWTAKGGEFRSARIFWAAQVIPLSAEQVIGYPFFWFVFFG